MSEGHWGEEAVRDASSSATGLMNHRCPGPHKASESIGKCCLCSCYIKLCFFLPK